MVGEAKVWATQIPYVSSPSLERERYRKNAYLKRKVGQLPSVSHHIVLWVWWHRWVGPPKKVTRDQLLWLCSLILQDYILPLSPITTPTWEIWKLFFVLPWFLQRFFSSISASSVATERGYYNNRPFDPIWHRIKITRVLKSWSVYNVRHSLCVLVLLFNLKEPRKLLLLCVPESKRAIFPCMQTAKKILHFSWGNQRESSSVEIWHF